MNIVQVVVVIKWDVFDLWRWSLAFALPRGFIVGFFAVDRTLRVLRFFFFTVEERQITDPSRPRQVTLQQFLNLRYANKVMLEGMYLPKHKMPVKDMITMIETRLQVIT